MSGDDTAYHRIAEAEELARRKAAAAAAAEALLNVSVQPSLPSRLRSPALLNRIKCSVLSILSGSCSSDAMFASAEAHSQVMI